MDGQEPQKLRPTGLVVRQSRRAAFHALVSTCPAVVRVIAGGKRITHAGQTCLIGAGQMVILPEAVPLTIENHPDDSGFYIAHAIPIARVVLERAYARLALAGRVVTARPVTLAVVPQDLGACFAEFLAPGPVESLPPSLVELRLEELAIRLALLGAVLGPARQPTLADGLHHLISQQPDAPWTADRAATALNTSTPTLRRRLAREGATFAAILQDVRMTHALGLLQTTDWSILRIAAEVGYSSPSRFATRFRKRFGTEPSKIRVISR